MMSAEGKELTVGEMNTPSGTDAPAAWKRWLPLVLIVAATAIAIANGWHRYLSLEVLIENRTELDRLVSENFLVTIAGFMALYIVSVALSLPGAAVLTIAGGLLFGVVLGSAITVIAATIGATALFLAAKTSLGHGLVERAGPWAEKLAGGFRADAFGYLLFLRLVPLFPFWLVNLAPALFGVSARTYVIATFFGIMPGSVAYTFIGAGLDSVIAAQRAANADCIGNADCAISIDLAALVTPELIAAFVMLGIVSLIPVALKKWRARKSGGTTGGQP